MINYVQNEVTRQRRVPVERTSQHIPVSALHAHGDAVVQLQPRDVAQPEDDPCAIRPADALSQLSNVSSGALP